MDSKQIQAGLRPSAQRMVASQQHPLSQTGDPKTDAMADLIQVLTFWQETRVDLAEGIEQVMSCVLDQQVENGRLDLSPLRDNPALPQIPLMLWRSLADYYKVLSKQPQLIVTLPAASLTGLAAKTTIDGLNRMPAVAALGIELPPVAQVDLSALGQGVHPETGRPLTPPQTIQVAPAREHQTGTVKTNLKAPQPSLVLGHDPKNCITVTQGDLCLPLGTGMKWDTKQESHSAGPSSSSSSSSSSASTREP